MAWSRKGTKPAQRQWWWLVYFRPSFALLRKTSNSRIAGSGLVGRYSREEQSQGLSRSPKWRRPTTEQNKGVNHKRGAVAKAVHITARSAFDHWRCLGHGMEYGLAPAHEARSKIRFLAKTLSKLACTAFPLGSTCPFHYRGSKSSANNSRTLFLAAASAFLPSGVIRYTVRRDLPYCFADPRR